MTKALLLVLSLVALIAYSPQSALAQAVQLKKSTVPTIILQQQELAPQQVAPAAPGTHGAVIPGVQLRTHCNGTCMCTGDDCDTKWLENCKKDSETCSGSVPGGDLICTCIKKAKLVE